MIPALAGSAGDMAAARCSGASQGVRLLSRSAHACGANGHRDCRRPARKGATDIVLAAPAEFQRKENRDSAAPCDPIRATPITGRYVPPLAANVDGAIDKRMFSNLWVRVCVLVAPTMLSWPLSATADTGHSFVVIVPSFRPPNPPPPAFPAQPAWQWAPTPPLGLTPGIPSPTARCYARTDVCPLTQADNIGQSCTCGTTTGHALIPPSHDISGRPTDQ